jgi:peptidoglycan hydrolase-like protein with peptidoglycan-binding domain
MVFVFAIAVGVSWVASVAADENVRAVQTKLRDDGFYSGDIDGAYSS